MLYVITGLWREAKPQGKPLKCQFYRSESLLIINNGSRGLCQKETPNAYSKSSIDEWDIVFMYYQILKSIIQQVFCSPWEELDGREVVTLAFY